MAQQHHQRQQYMRKTQRLMLILGASILLLTFPYLAYNVSLFRLCSAACTLRRLIAALRAEDPRLRLADCRDHSPRLLAAFGLNRIDLSRPTYVWLTSPVDISGSCVDTSRLMSQHPPAESSAGDACFNQSYSVSDKLQVYEVLHRLQENFTQRGLQIFMSDGSLLGSQRHFGIIPWDDDIDFLILREQKFEVRELLIKLSELDEFSFSDTENINNHWRLDFLCQVDRAQPPVPRYGLSRLFLQKECRIALDMFFADVLGDHFLRPEMPYVYNTKEVYPLQLLPFGPHLMWAPANPQALSASQYGRDYEFTCMFETHSHRFPCREKFLECDRLRRIYPFVSHAVLWRRGRNFTADILVWKSQAMAIFIPPQGPRDVL